MGGAREALVIVGAGIWSMAGCTTSTTISAATDASMTISDGGPEVSSNDAAVAISDARAASCNIAPYPQGLACDDPTQACVPESGWDCCLCEDTTHCRYPVEWVCVSSYPRCPATPPAVGTPCSLPEFSSCVYCYQPAVFVACSNGTWQTVLNNDYCLASD
jgi:hypothetical protein